MRRAMWICFTLSAILTVFTSCTAAVKAFQDEQAPGQQAARAVAESTGNPLIIAGVNAALTLLTGFLAARSGKNAAEAKDNEEWSAEDVESFMAKARAHGFKVERV